MNRKSLRSFVSYVVTVAFVAAPSAPAWGSAQAEDQLCSSLDANKLKDDAESAFTTGQANSDLAAKTTDAGSGQKGASTAITSSGSKCSVAWSNAIAALKKCQKQCDKSKDKNVCAGPIKNHLEGASTAKGQCDAQTVGGTETGNAVDSGGGESGGSAGGGMGGMGDMLMGAALGAGLMYLMNKKKDDDKKKEDGPVDCKSDSASQYAECTNMLLAECVGDTTSPRCSSFYSSYCSAKSGENSSTRAAGSDMSGATTASATPSTPGEGIGSPFCQNQMAVAFCKTSGRNMCPSCLQLATANSPTCQANPSLCMQQNSPEQLEAARQSCPTDPIFANPSSSASRSTASYDSGQGSASGANPDNSGGSNASQQASPITATNSAQTASVSGGGASSSRQASSTAGSGGGASDASSGVGSGGGASASASSTGGSSGSNYHTASVSGSGGSSDTASGSANRSLASQGPRSDVGGAYSGSLFSKNSQVFEQRCKQRRLAGCTN